MLTLPRLSLVLAVWLLVRSALPAAAPPRPNLDLELLAARLTTQHRHTAIPATGDPSRKLGFRVWARERYEGALALASSAEREAMEAVLARHWRNATAKNDVDAMRGVIALVGVEHPLGQEARLYLARRLGTLGYSPAADQLLQEVRLGPNAPSAAKAVLELAEMTARARQLRDALAYYRILGREFANERVAPGNGGAVSTGAEVLAELATDKRFIPLLEKPRLEHGGPVGLRYREEVVTTQERTGFTFPSLGKALPFFEQHRLILIANELRMWDRESESGRDEFYFAVPNTGFGAIGDNFSLGTQVRLGHQSLGHVVIVNLGAKVVGVDPLGRKMLWQHDVLGLGTTEPVGRAVDYGNEEIDGAARKPRLLLSPPPVDYRKDDSARIDYGIAGSLRLGGAVPLTPTRLCLAMKKGLTALDPVTGEMCWSRTDVPQDCRLIDDGVHVFVVRFTAGGKAAGTAAYRLRDGAPVDIKDFSDLYERRLNIVDGRLLVWEEAAGKAPALRLYDVAAGKDDWRQEYPAGAMPIRCEDPALTGVVEPEGKVRVLEARTKKAVMSTTLRHLDPPGKVKVYRLVGDADNFYLAGERPRGEDVVSEPRPLFLPSAGLRAIPVNGMLHAFRRDTGALVWYNEVQNQMLLVSEIEHLPLLLLASRYYEWVDKPPRLGIFAASKIRAIAKKGGKLWYVNDDVPPRMSYIHRVRVDQGTGKVEVLGRWMKVGLWAVPR